MNETYQLPDPTNDDGALGPHIIGQIWELHHDHHHAGYLKVGSSGAAWRLVDWTDVAERLATSRRRYA